MLSVQPGSVTGRLQLTFSFQPSNHMPLPPLRLNSQVLSGPLQSWCGWGTGLSMQGNNYDTKSDKYHDGREVIHVEITSAEQVEFFFLKGPSVLGIVPFETEAVTIT